VNDAVLMIGAYRASHHDFQATAICPPALLVPPAGQMTATRKRTRQFRLESSFRRCTLDGNLREWPELGGSSFEPCPDDQSFARYRLHPARDIG
jgi:hypothetical protein